jgi:putative ABC transport system permease protein
MSTELALALRHRLVMMWQTDRRTGAPLMEVSYPEFEAWRDHSRSFEGLAAMTSTNFRVNLTGKGEPLQVEGAAVSHDFFDALGARPALGRGFRPEEDAAGVPRPAPRLKNP